MNTQHGLSGLTTAEYAARLADAGEHVVLVRPDGTPFGDWLGGASPTSQQLRLWMKCWRDAFVRVVRDGKLVDPLAPKPPVTAPESASVDRLAEPRAAPVVAAIPAIILAPILVPAVIEDRRLNPAMVKAMGDMLAAVETMASMLGRVDLAGLPRESLNALVLAAITEVERRDSN